MLAVNSWSENKNRGQNKESAVALDEVVSRVESQFTSPAKVADARLFLAGEDATEAAVIPSLSQPRVELQGTRVVGNGTLVVLALSVERGAVVVEVGVLRCETKGTVEVAQDTCREQFGGCSL